MAENAEGNAGAPRSARAGTRATSTMLSGSWDGTERDFIVGFVRLTHDELAGATVGQRTAPASAIAVPAGVYCIHHGGETAICRHGHPCVCRNFSSRRSAHPRRGALRSEEHTSELQSP